MPFSTAGAALIIRAATPLIKDLYEGAKGASSKALRIWKADKFPDKLFITLTELDKVRTIWSPEKNISLRDFYYPSRIKSSDGPLSVNYISDLGSGCIAVQGIVGQGKSILLRYLAMQELSHPEKPRIPLFIELRKLSKDLTLMGAIKKSLIACDIDVNDDVFTYLANSEKIVILLDGFDEIESNIVKASTLEIEDIVSRHPKLQVIVSSRPDNEIQKLSKFNVVDIHPLGTEDYFPFLKKLSLDTDKIIAIVDAITGSPSNVASLITTPLMLTLVVMVYQSESQIPAELPEFFEKLFYTVFTRHDKLKPTFERQHYSSLSEKKLQELFEAFCFMAMQAGHGRTLNSSQFSEAFELAQDCVKGSSCTEDGFRKDITKVSCLMLEEGFQDVTFLHKSIAEYHAAAFVKDSDDSFAKEFYEIASDNWSYWKECLSFLKSIDKYRFSKFFTLINITPVVSTIQELANCNSAHEVAKILPNWMKDVSVHFNYFDLDSPSHEEEEETDNFNPVLRTGYRLALCGTWDKPSNFYFRYYPESISTSLLASAPEVLSELDIDQLIASGKQIRRPDDDTIEIGIIDALDAWAMDQFKIDTRSFLINLQTQLKDANETSRMSDNRMFILSKKRDQVTKP